MSSSEHITVLVADHDRWARLSLTGVLLDTGFGVQEASNGMSALRLAAATPPHVVLIGPRLSEISTPDVLRTLRADPRTRHTAVVQYGYGPFAAATGDADPDVDGHLDLPCNPIELLATMVTALEARRAMLVSERSGEFSQVGRAASFERRRGGVGVASMSSRPRLGIA